MTTSSAQILAKRPMADLSRARARYLEGDPAPPGVRPVVLASWQRSVAHGIHPGELRTQSPDTDRLARARQASRRLLEAADPFLELVHETLAEEPHLVVLSDRDGLVLRALTGPGLPDDLEAANLFEGASWHEGDLGCNGVGTALATGEPVILIGPEHFQESYVGWTCIGVPIRDSGGALLGALDLSVPNEHTHVHAWGWMLSVAKGIEGNIAGRGTSIPSPMLDPGRLDQPLQAVRGVFDLLAQELDLPPTHAHFLAEGRAALEAAEAELKLAMEDAARSAGKARRELSEIASIYDTAPVGLCVFDRELRYLRINERLARINGIPAAEHIGRSVRQVVPHLADIAEPLLRRVIETGEPVLDLELSGETAAHPGETRHWVEHYFPLRGESGEIFGINVVVEEVTDRTRAETELREAYRAARSALEERDNVLAVVSHDLRNPLNTILMAASLLTEDLSEEKKAVQTGIIHSSANRMTRLIEDLLDVTRIEGGGLGVVPESCRAADLVRAAIEALTPLAESRSLSLHGSCESQRSARADVDRILQVFTNLVSNAVDHTPEGGRIEIAAEDAKHEVRFMVRDDGAGISPEDAAHVFDRFWQATESGRAGAGLGLAIAKGIVEAHGGRMWMESEKGTGSSFFFTLPAEPPPGREPDPGH